MNFIKRWLIKRHLSKIDVTTQCYIDGHKSNIIGISDDYMLLAHRHDNGILVIDSFEKRVVKPIEEQIKELQKKYNIKDDSVFRA